ncbi:hypothetical protein KCP71_10090 [Salmonella enterica subsp. enterica]|nr:hypothetical protein KCP71_10090 [Salmonella enterica subsp. enterica]
MKLNISAMRPLTSSRSGCTAENDNQNCRKCSDDAALSGLRYADFVGRQAKCRHPALFKRISPNDAAFHPYRVLADRC